MVTRQELLDALTAERFGTPGILTNTPTKTPPEVTAEQWRRLKELAREAAKTEEKAV